MKRPEAAVFAGGFALLVVAVATVSWQFALGLLGIGLMVSVFDLPRVRR